MPSFIAKRPRAPDEEAGPRLRPPRSKPVAQAPGTSPGSPATRSTLGLMLSARQWAGLVVGWAVSSSVLLWLLVNLCGSGYLLPGHLI